MGKARVAHYLLGIEGVALMRSWLVGDPARARARVEEIKRFVSEPEDAVVNLELDVPELEVRAGYAAWTLTYDRRLNPLIMLEEPVVRSLIDRAPLGRALDAACGTGRYAAYLHARGHTVVGVDTTQTMLGRSRVKVPQAALCAGDLQSLPLATASVDLVVCALALTHVPALGPALAELARVTRPGGRLIVSDLHPLTIVLGGQALFQAADGSYALVCGYYHRHADYLAAFADAGLVVRQCSEPAWTAATVPIMADVLYAFAPEAFHDAMVDVPGALVWELARH